ncbi:hypothetical protein EUX98_g5560 [Antrodiella citrinella]|uniref:DUF6535 domain-containing protein n=1 Tax=Antrodiella citrinella TaxID=2447956 RepID=A0A4S4MTE2_9APHY|nr:hypothetical protein EUX98_g5560 [Antrodiella citrinella]
MSDRYPSSGHTRGIKISKRLKDVTGDVEMNPIWSLYNLAAERSDEILIARLRDSMSSVLIIAGLFSATVTSLVVESYQSLSPDPAHLTVQYLAQISQQLAAIAQGPNSGNFSSQPVIYPIAFQSTSSDVAVNMLWILSLVFSLGCALSATMVLSWLNKYLRLVNRYADPRGRARQHTFFFKGLEESRLNLLVETLPAFLHVSFSLFFLGIIVFLSAINTLIANVTLFVVCVFALLYLGCTMVPTFVQNSPYETPLSALLSFICSSASLTVRAARQTSISMACPSFLSTKAIKRQHAHPQLPMHVKFRAPETKDVAPTSPKQDAMAIHWLLRSMEPQTEQDIERIVQCIEPFVNSIDDHAENGAIMFQLGDHLPLGSLLVSCIHPTDVPLSQRHARVTLCTRALWSLFVKTDTYSRKTTDLVPRTLTKGTLVHPWRLWLDVHTISTLRNLQGDPDPLISFHAICASTVAACAGISDFCCKVDAGEFQLHGFAGLGILDVVHAIWGRMEASHSAFGMQALQDHICELKIAAGLLLLREEVKTGRLWESGSPYRCRYDSKNKIIRVTKDGCIHPMERHSARRLHAEGCLLVLNHFLRNIVTNRFTPSVAHVHFARETLNSIVNAAYSSSASGPFYSWGADGTSLASQREFTSLFGRVLHTADPSLAIDISLQHALDNDTEANTVPPSYGVPSGFPRAALEMPSPEIPTSLVSQDFVGMLTLIAVGIDDPICKRECNAWMDAWYSRIRWQPAPC